MTSTAAVFFDVDFTLIRPGRRFQAAGYAETCRRHGVTVSVEAFEAGITEAATLLEWVDLQYQDDVWVRYTARIIEVMGGKGPGVVAAAREIYADWAEHRHFEMYDDVPDTLRTLHARGLRIGLITNSHRPLDSFQEHFSLQGLVTVAVSSAEFGVMKPDRRIFDEALHRMRVAADSAVMVGDSLAHDVAGARQAGMRGVWLDRLARGTRPDDETPVITSLIELPALL